MSEGGGVSGPLPEVYDVRQLWSDYQHTADPWDEWRVVSEILTRLGCLLPELEAAWDAGDGRTRQTVKLLAKDAFLYAALQRGEGKKVGEARRWFERNPDRLANIAAVYEGRAQLPCPTGFPRSPRTDRRERREGRGAVREAERAERLRRRNPPPPILQATQPRGGTQRPPGAISQSALDNLQTALQRLAEWYAQREAQRQAERDARRARNAATGGVMSLGDIASALGGGIERIATAAIPVATAIYNERIMREQRRAAPTGASGVPLGALASFADIGGGAVMPADFDFDQPLLDQLMNRLMPGATAGSSSTAPAAGLYRTNALGRAVPNRTVLATNPSSGTLQAWEYKGSPVLYSGDLRTCRRVRKIARGAAAGVGLRFRRRGGR